VTERTVDTEFVQRSAVGGKELEEGREWPSIGRGESEPAGAGAGVGAGGRVAETE
jgi:hypothetical protein